MIFDAFYAKVREYQNRFGGLSLCKNLENLSLFPDLMRLDLV